ncbi:RNA polymerase sigma factor (sigma-70 family) [Phycicoccus badiiscoriae]|uniref:RNA polymerase sigma factor (Sigma-70 family) n=1 Tax=Pedococcus badiiscoriae TaxID=642776 RepID=A0A852WR02_9MICO|nr:RNA polymerase sigma factor (sigma-70 family) [Pedococcus badiiscoriae]
MTAPIDLSQADDIQLTEWAREGEDRAVVELWTRHFPAALATARGLARQPRDAEELASDAFSGMLAALRSGGGPTGSVRSYLLTSVRNRAVSRSRLGSAGEVLTGETVYLENAADVARDPVAAAGELSLMREAFATLSPRWQHVLWRTAVEHETNIVVAKEMGLTPNGVAALSRRARLALRAAFVQVHVSRGDVDAACLPFIDGLAALVANPEADTETAEHVRGCARCTERLAELRRVDKNLSGILGPALFALIPGGAGGAVALGGSAVGASAAGGSAASSATAESAGASWGSSWAAAAAGAAAVGIGILAWVLWPSTEVTPRPVAATASTTTSAAPAPTSTSVAATTTQAPTPTPTSSTAPRPSPTRATSSTSRPVPVPAPPRPTTSAPSTTPAPVGHLSMGIAMGGPAATPFIQLSASGQQLAGGLGLTLTVPSGVTLTGSTGAWQQCTQSGVTIRCVGAATSTQSWSGTISTSWAPKARGAVTATVKGTYRSGVPAAATAATTWPPEGTPPA